MNLKSKLVSAGGTALLVALPLVGIVGSPAHAETAVPFNSTAQGSYGQGGGTGTEIGTHAGRGTVETHIIATLPAGFTCPTGQLPTRIRQSVLHTAANGDQIFATNEIAGCLVLGGVSEFTGTELVTGGTGRFAGSTGELSNSTTLDDTPNPVNVSGDFTARRSGTISFAH